MNDARQHPPDPIREALRQLPRERASADFNRELLDRLDRPSLRPQPLWPRLAAAATLAAALTGGLYLAGERAERLDLQRQRTALEQRHEELRRDLARLKRQAASPPQLYLATGSDIDLVLDLEPWMEQPLDVQPASYSESRQ